MTRSRLHLGLQLSALGANVASFVVLALLSPGVLLLEPDVFSAALVESAWTVPIVLGLAAFATTLRMRTIDARVVCIEQGEVELAGVDAKLARRLHALPLSWVIQLTLQSVAVSTLTIVPALRPSIIDLNTQTAIVLLTAAITIATSLPLYVVARAIAGATLEAIPWQINEEAMRGQRHEGLFDPGWFRARQVGQVHGRLLYAVALPVAIVAFGAALLADAHVRAFETRSRRDDAYALARGVLEPEGSAGTAGRDAAMRMAESLGYHVAITSTEEPTSTIATPGEGGVRTLRTRLEDGIASVRFQPTSGGSPIAVYVVCASLAIAFAALVGRGIGRAVSGDLASATRQVRLLGTQDVMRGVTRVAGPTRFQEIAALGTGVEQVAERFREFARGRERMIEARESAQRMRDLFLASMSHDLRSPLNGILGFVALLQKGQLSLAQQESLAIIDRRGRELLELIENILDAAKIEAGRLELALDYVTPDELLARAVERGRELAGEKPLGEAVEVMGERQPGIRSIYADGQRLTQAIINLVANAVKFVDRGVVRIRISQGVMLAQDKTQEKTALKIEVEDQGRGIPEKELAQIFDAFRQPIRSRRHGGLGLGLSMTRALVELHGGTIEVSSSPERGSVFTLWIPYAPPGEESQRLSFASLRRDTNDLGDSERSSTRSVPPPRSVPSPPRSIPPPATIPPRFEVVRLNEDQEYPTVQMPALELPPDSGEIDIGATVARARHRTLPPPSRPAPPPPSRPPPPSASRPPPLPASIPPVFHPSLPPPLPSTRHPRRPPPRPSSRPPPPLHSRPPDVHVPPATRRIDPESTLRFDEDEPGEADPCSERPIPPKSR